MKIKDLITIITMRYYELGRKVKINFYTHINLKIFFIKNIFILFNPNFSVIISIYNIEKNILQKLRIIVVNSSSNNSFYCSKFCKY